MRHSSTLEAALESPHERVEASSLFRRQGEVYTATPPRRQVFEMNPTGGGEAGDPFGDPGFGTGAPVQPAAGVGYQGSFGAAPAPYSSYGRFSSPIAGGYGGAYGNGYAGMYGAGTAGGGSAFSPYAGTYAGRYGALVGGAMQAQAGGAAVLSGMQEAMQRFARVSGLMEEVLRNLHMLFDGVFGLGYSLGAFHNEARMWLAVKSGPAAFAMRMFAKLTRLWRLLTIFLCSPLAGEFSPVAIVLRILGIAPPEDTGNAHDDSWSSSFVEGRESSRGALPGPSLLASDSNL